MGKPRLIQINFLPESFESRKRRIAYMASSPTLWGYLVSTWQSSANWPWFTVIFGIAFAVSATMGEYGLAEIVLLFAAVGASSQLIQHKTLNWVLKMLGVMGVLFVWAIFSYATYKEMDTKPWSHIQPLIENYEIERHPLSEDAKRLPSIPFRLIPAPPAFAFEKSVPAPHREMSTPKSPQPPHRIGELQLSVVVVSPTDPVVLPANLDSQGLVF
jgi:type III secretory pathway component EscS